MYNSDHETENKHIPLDTQPHSIELQKEEKELSIVESYLSLLVFVTFVICRRQCHYEFNTVGLF